jgi:hypothetical protein
MGTIYINPKEQMQIVSSYYQKPGGIIIHLTKSGDYCYGSGKPVNVRSHFAFLSGKDREDAIAWFEKKYGTAKTGDNSQETHSEPIVLPTEPDLDAEAAELPDEVV